MWKENNQKYFTNLKGDRFGKDNILDPKIYIIKENEVNPTKKRDTATNRKKGVTLNLNTEKLSKLYLQKILKLWKILTK